MKENINEHDMTKKMMNIIRGGYKSKLIKEAEEEATAAPTAEPQQQQAKQLVPGDDLPEPEQDESKMAESPKDGSHEPIKASEDNFDYTYIELEKNGDTYKDLEQQIKQLTNIYEVTSIYISPKNKDILINGLVTKNFRFSMWLNQDEVETEGQIDSDKAQDYLDKLKRFRDNLAGNRLETEKKYINDNPELEDK